MALRALDPIVGAIVRELRVARGISQDSLAAQAGVASATLRSLEHASKLPHRATVIAVAAALEVTLESLLALVDARRATHARGSVLAAPRKGPVL